MARGDFLKGLSEGIFERQRELNLQQEAKDFQGKQDLVRMLTGLADKVEPESLPTLMGHIWDTMGIKKQGKSGKGLRGFLDAFSGMPDRSIEDQLGTKFRELTQGGMVGPEEARGIRLRNNMAQKGIPGLVGAAPTSMYGQQAAQANQGLKGKLVFDDPYRRKLGEIEARYGAQLENQRQRQEDSHAAAMQRLLTTYDLKREQDLNRYNQKISLGVDQLAHRFLMDPDIQAFPPELRKAAARQKAQSYFSEEAQSKAEYLDAGTEARRAKAARDKAETPGKGGKGITPYQRAQLDEKTIADVQEIIGRLGPAAKTALELEKTYNPLKKQMEDIAAKRGLQYSAEAGVFLGDPVKVKVAEAFAGDSLKLAREARDKFREAAGKAEAEHLKLKDKRFQGYLNIGESWRDAVTVASERARKVATPPPKATKRLPRPGPNAVKSSEVTNPTGEETFDATTPTGKAGDMNQKIYKVREDNLQKTLSTLKGNWVVGETITEDGVRKVIIRRKE